MTIQDQRALPSGPIELAHRSLQSGLRAWVERQTRLPLGYVEQLYTFADLDRAGAAAQHVISISYLGLTLAQRAKLSRNNDAAKATNILKRCSAFARFLVTAASACQTMRPSVACLASLWVGSRGSNRGGERAVVMPHRRPVRSDLSIEPGAKRNKR